MITEAERFNTDHPDLCHCLRWKGMFIQVEPDPSVPPTNQGLFWCLYTQTCIGPDGQLAEPGACSSSGRACHGTGRVA
jgi:hypothetical protein